MPTQPIHMGLTKTPFILGLQKLQQVYTVDPSHIVV